jgi:TRAP-type C4-dicarboxylate transport system permease small subunit
VTRTPPVTRGLELLCAALMAVLVCLLFMQVAARYVLSDPPDWTEELARVVFAYVTFIGAAVAIARHAHLKIDLLPAAMPQNLRSALRIVWLVGAIVFLVVVLYQSFRLLGRLSHQPLTALPVSKAVFFAAVPVGCGLMLLYEAAELVGEVRSIRARRQAGR